MCNLYSTTTNQAAISALFRVVNRYVGNLAPMPGVFPDYKAPIVRTGADGRGLATARLGMPSSAHAHASILDACDCFYRFLSRAQRSRQIQHRKTSSEPSPLR